MLLKKAGFHIIIDNFGSDAIIYNRIFELQAEYIKVDGSLIKELSQQGVRGIIAESIIKFAREGGIKIIAEHVENVEIYEIVKAHGIEFSQGFAIAKPSLSL